MGTLKYLGTIKGQILKAIAVDSLYQWGELRDNLGFTNEQLRPYIKELKSEGILEERGNEFRIEYELWLRYKAHFGDEWAKRKLKELSDGTEWRQVILRKHALEKEESEKHLINRVMEWIKFKKLDVPQRASQIFLKGDQLDSLLRDIIPLSKKEIIVVNPYVEKSALCDLLMLEAGQGIDVQLITQSPTKDKYPGSRSAKTVYHKKFVEYGVQVFYNDNVHAKLFILDKQVLTVSSMNLYSESIAGKLWEAGIVSTNPYTLKMAIDAYQQFLTDPYTYKLT